MEGEGEEGAQKGEGCEGEFFDCIQLGALGRASNVQWLGTRAAALRITAVAEAAVSSRRVLM